MLTNILEWNCINKLKVRLVRLNRTVSIGVRPKSNVSLLQLRQQNIIWIKFIQRSGATKSCVYVTVSKVQWNRCSVCRSKSRSQRVTCCVTTLTTQKVLFTAYPIKNPKVKVVTVRRAVEISQETSMSSDLQYTNTQNLILHSLKIMLQSLREARTFRF